MAEREILFRGKLKDKDEWIGEWIEGIYCPCSWDLYMRRVEKPRIIILSNKGKTDGLWREVIPETVGQYTGLIDKNDKRIFEGDIVKVTYTSSDGETRTETTLVKYDEIDCCFYPMRWNERCEWCDYSTEIKEIEVIGNIHDNPELLKGGGDNG